MQDFMCPEETRLESRLEPNSKGFEIQAKKFLTLYWTREVMKVSEQKLDMIGTIIKESQSSRCETQRKLKRIKDQLRNQQDSGSPGDRE